MKRKIKLSFFKIISPNRWKAGRNEKGNERVEIAG